MIPWHAYVIILVLISNWYAWVVIMILIMSETPSTLASDRPDTADLELQRLGNHSPAPSLALTDGDFGGRGDPESSRSTLLRFSLCLFLKLFFLILWRIFFSFSFESSSCYSFEIFLSAIFFIFQSYLIVFDMKQNSSYYYSFLNVPYK